MSQVTPNNFANLLNPIKVAELARQWINEDVPSFDVQGFMVGDREVTANVYCKHFVQDSNKDGLELVVLAGVPFVDAICQVIGLQRPHWLHPEGKVFELKPNAGEKIIVGTVTGPAKLVLLAERTILNVLCRCSGVASVCRQIRIRLDEAGWGGQLVGTRKTTPGFRMVEKYGLMVGGAGTHRYDMSSLVMLKDNHVKLSGTQMVDMIRQAKTIAGFHCKVEVECGSVSEATEAGMAGADVVMLDNFSGSKCVAAANELKQRFGHLLIEASGGINEQNVLHFATPPVDVISMSRLVQGYPTIDFSMKINQV